MYTLDALLTHAINSLAGISPTLDMVLIAISAYAVPVLIVLVAIQWWPKADREGYRHTALAAGFTFFLSLGANQIILLFVHRIRPYDVGITHLLIAPSIDPSFPSDHATAAFAIAFTFFIHGMRKQGALFCAAAALIAFSRVFVGIHYVGDVLGGAVVALLVASVVKYVFRPNTALDRLLANIL